MLGHMMIRTAHRRFGESVYGVFRGMNGIDDKTWNRVFGSAVTYQKDVQNYIAELISSVQPDYVINCVGFIKHRGNDRHRSIRINALLPHRLASMLQPPTKLIHISTDCVFNGISGFDTFCQDHFGYSETAQTNADDDYGKSKALGEVVDNPNALTIRTSIIGRELCHYTGLLEWFLHSSGSIKGFAGHIYSGVTTNYLSERICDIMELGKESFPSGLMHVASEPISKLELLFKLKQAFGHSVNIQYDKSSFLNRVLQAESPAKWDEMIAELVADKEIYDQANLQGEST